MQILILGGNGQLGRHLVQAFVDAGHAVTCLARGTQPMPDSARFLQADRDLTDALGEAAGLSWDVVVELTTSPGRVRRAVGDLTADHWFYVSSTSAYQRGDVLEQDEDSPVHDPLEADSPSGMEDYGPAKVACENEVRSGTLSATVIRPGLIAGAADDTGRSGYYPWRFAHPTGEDVLVPDDPDFPIAMIDVKDLAAWMVRCAEQRLVGTFNATGSTVTLRAATADTRRAREHGLACRPLESTLADALAYEESRGGPVGAGLSDMTEHNLRTALDVGA